MSRTRSKIAGDSFQPEFGKRGELRLPFGRSGRVHLDRWLPFIVLHRSAEPSQSIARRVAVNSPSYLIWSPEDDPIARQALEAVAEATVVHLGRLLIMSVEDSEWEPAAQGSQQLPKFEFRIGASEASNAGLVLDCLGEALGKVRVDLRAPEVRKVDVDPFAPCLDSAGAETTRISLSIPQIHRVDRNHFYPQLTHDLAVAVGDSLLRAACEYIVHSGFERPAHYRALGRSAFLAAALDADKRLDRVARSFDFLLSISPINTREAAERFFAAGEDETPEFRYRPLTVDPDSAKRDLYAVDLSILEDPLLERLLSEKRQELDHQLTMLSTRNTPAFQPASLLQYGTVGSKLLEDALAILSRPKGPKAGGERVGAAEVAAAAKQLVASYASADARFAAAIEVRDDVAGLLVSGGKLMIASGTSMLRSRLEALLAHEVSVHLLTHFNGAAQGLTVFRTGLAGYEGVQEGLGVFAEWAVGGLSEARLRLLAGRVVSVAAMLDGAQFIESYRLLRYEHGLGQKAAFDITARVFRSGGFAKDLIYLKGFQSVVELIGAGASLRPFWIGKIAPGHVGAIEELLQRKLVQPPVFEPEFLERDDVAERISRLRANPSFDAILELE